MNRKGRLLFACLFYTLLLNSMRTLITISLSILFFALNFSCTLSVKTEGETTVEDIPAGGQINNPIITDKYTADPAALVYNDAVYLYVGHDQAIIEFKNNWYYFYHTGGIQPHGGSYRRSVCIDRLYYNADGTMKRIVMTSEGIQ